ncbi:MAG: hypothetical protein QXS20_06395 [Candidatus Thorarchaeota archaeon]
MSSKRTGEPTADRPDSMDVDSFEFDPSSLDLEWSKDFITVFDGYRIHRCFDLTFIEKALGEGKLGKDFIRQWKFVRTVLHRFAAVSPEVPGVMTWYTRRQALRFFSLILITVTVPAVVLSWVFYQVWLIPYTITLAIIAGLTMAITWTMGHYYNRKIAWAIEHYWEDHPELLVREKMALKRWTQTTIHHARRLMRRTGADPAKNLIKFYNNDYEGIRVLNEPNLYRKHYTVQLEV